MTDRRWRVDLGEDGPHFVELAAAPGGGPLVFRCEGAEYSLGRGVFRGHRVVSFAIAGHPATMTLTVVRIGFGTRLRQGFRILAQRSPGTAWGILAAALAGLAFLARGLATLAGYEAAMAASVWWRIYELTVDGSTVGWQVARLAAEGGELESWTHVAPGGALPDGSNWYWPEVSKH